MGQENFRASRHTASHRSTGYYTSINPILIWIYPCKRGWSDLPHSNSNLSNSHSLSCSIQGILLLQTNFHALLLHLRLPRLHWSFLLPLTLHFKLQCFSQNMPIIPPQHMLIPSHSIRLCHLNHCSLIAKDSKFLGITIVSTTCYLDK